MLMIHQYKVGDKVRIKEREGKSIDYPCYFVDEMCQQKGKIFTIKNISELSSSRHVKRKFYNGDNHFYLFEENGYTWHSSMFEPALENPKSNAQTLCPLKEGDSISICGMIGRIQDGGYYCHRYYLDFDNIKDDQEHLVCCKKLRELVPDFEKIANEFDATHEESDCFPEFSTIDDLVKFAQAVNNAYNSKKSITISKTLNENEIRFQKPKTSSIRGSVPTGRAICGRRRKTAIELGHLSNTTCYC